MPNQEYSFYFGLLSKEDEQVIFDILCESDKEFYPPLSYRNSTTQAGLSLDKAAEDKPYVYFEEMKKQQFINVYDGKTLCAFLSYKVEQRDNQNCFYISTLCVAHSYRGRGLLHILYDKVEELAKSQDVKTLETRTWSTHEAQIKTLAKRGFILFKAIENDRPNGVGTVYFKKELK